MADDIPEEQIEEYRDTFDLFDRTDTGSISLKDLGNVMRALGENPTQAEIDKIVSDVDTEGTGTIEFEDFVGVMMQFSKGDDKFEELHDAFKVFDKEGKGYVSASEMRNFLTSLGETLTKDEADELLKDANVDTEGMIYYDEFVHIVTSLK